MFRLVLLAVVLALVAADPVYHRGSGNEARVNAHNAQRQFHVNAIADKGFRGTGTADWEGAPGTPLGRTGYGHHGQGYGGHGFDGYGHGFGGYGQGFGGHGQGFGGYGHGFGGHGHGFGGY